MANDQGLEQRLQFSKINTDTKRALRQIWPALKDALPGALDAFYSQIRATPEAAKFFSTDSQISGAKTRQIDHWGAIAGEDLDQHYVARVAKVGAIHARIGLAPKWYIGGYALILDHLVRQVLAKAEAKRGLFGKDAKAAEELASGLAALVKVAMLDMDFVLSTYLDASDAERLRIADVQKAAAAEQKIVVESLAGGLRQLADGVLVYRLNEPFASDYEPLRLDFNAAMDKLQDTMTAVAGNTSAIRAGAQEITTATDDLSRRTEQQAASLEETAAALDEITATVKKTADGAIRANTAVAAARSDAEASGKVVREAVSAMSLIEKSSAQIGRIIGVIDEIAFQTNLLALNAGVEAARAGDAGRGFAVVASEVRALAQRSAEAAKEIKGLIEQSKRHVGAGVALVAETGKALDRIVSQVVEISGVVSEIAASAQEQAGGLHEVNSAVNQMDQVTQQNAAMVEEATAASHAQATETESLADLISQFEVGAVAKKVTPGRSRPSVSSSPQRPVRAPSAIMMKTVGQGGAVRQAAPRQADPSEGTWEEF